MKKGYESVKETHLEDYQEMFDRVSLDIGQTVSDKTTDQLLAAYKNGSASDAEKRQLEVMLFQYGRYLTLGSSREDSQLPSTSGGMELSEQSAMVIRLPHERKPSDELLANLFYKPCRMCTATD